MATKTQSKPGSADRPAMKTAAAELERVKKDQAARSGVATPKQHAVAVRKTTEVSAAVAASFEEDAGDGMRNVDADSVAIPFITVLQKNSPQCDPDQGEYMPDAKPGMLYNTVTRRLYDGKVGIKIVPCNYMRKFLQWAAREVGGGFRGEHAPEAVVRMRESGSVVELENRLYVTDGSGPVNPKKNDKISDTRVHYVLVLDEETGLAQQAVVSLSSTQIKKSKQLNSMLSNVALPRSDGSMYTPASYANVVQMTTVPESNEKGNWSGVLFELDGQIQDPATYQMAKAFSKLVEAGRATVNYDAARGAGEEEGGDGQGGRF